MNPAIQNDISFIKESKIFNLNPNLVDIAINKSMQFLNYKNIVFTTGTEVFINKKSFDKIQEYCNYLKKYDINAKILTSTLSDIDNGFYPLTNLLCWNGAKHYGDTYPIFNDEFFIKNSHKSKKFILSWRKDTNLRSEIISKIDLNKIIYDECIFKYHQLNPIQSTRIDSMNAGFKGKAFNNEFVKWYDILDLYSHSYISFVAETEYWISDDIIRDGSIVPLTEKILIPFLSKSLPIVFAGDGYIKNLKDNGLFVLNDYFSITETDVDSYSKCVSDINSMSIQEVESIYNKHLFEINRNYEIISKMILIPFWNFENGRFSNFI